MITELQDGWWRMIDHSRRWRGATRRFGYQRVAWTLVFLLQTLTGCSSEGGVVGSGISSVQGNVIDVQLDGAAEDESAVDTGAGGAVAPVLVSLDNEGLETVTDVDGYFSLDGDFAGAVTLRFSNPDGGESFGTFPLEIASGATMFLRDVEIRRDLDLEEAVIVSEPLHLNLAGTVRETDCASGRIEVVDNAAAGNAFRLYLNLATEVVDQHDNALDCADLSIGAKIVLEEGILNFDDGSINAVKLVADPTTRPPLRKEILVRRRGVVLRAECGDGQVIQILDSQLGDVVRVEFGPATQLVCANQPRCSCGDIRFGQVAEVRGLRHLVQPGTLVAKHVRVEPNTVQFLHRVVTGDIASIDCAAGTATIVDVRLADPLHGETPADLPPFDVDLSEDTQYRCGRAQPRPCECGDVGRRSRVQLDAQIPLAGGPFLALRVTVIAMPLISVRGRS